MHYKKVHALQLLCGFASVRLILAHQYEQSLDDIEQLKLWNAQFKQVNKNNVNMRMFHLTACIFWMAIKSYDY